MDELRLHSILTAYLAGELALESSAQALAAAYRRDGWGLYIDAGPDVTPAVRARAAALWARYAELTAPPRSHASETE